MRRSVKGNSNLMGSTLEVRSGPDEDSHDRNEGLHEGKSTHR